jgi:hypothetical protein
VGGLKGSSYVDMRHDRDVAHSGIADSRVCVKERKPQTIALIRLCANEFSFFVLHFSRYVVEHISGVSASCF